MPQRLELANAAGPQVSSCNRYDRQLSKRTTNVNTTQELCRLQVHPNSFIKMPFQTAAHTICQLVNKHTGPDTGSS